MTSVKHSRNRKTSIHYTTRSNKSRSTTVALSNTVNSLVFLQKTGVTIDRVKVINIK